MKKTFSLLAIVLMIALVFTGCGSNGESSSSSGTTGGSTPVPAPTVFVGVDPVEGITNTLTFENDGTFTMRYTGTWENITFNVVHTKGTYTGNPKTDGNVTITITHWAIMSDQPSGTTATNDDFPLEAYTGNHAQKSLTVSGNLLYGTGSLLFHEAAVFTRKLSGNVVYKAFSTSGEECYIITFYTDGTFISLMGDHDEAGYTKGTYTGNLNANGTISATATHIGETDEGTLEAYTGTNSTQTFTISNSGNTLSASGVTLTRQ